MSSEVVVVVSYDGVVVKNEGGIGCICTEFESFVHHHHKSLLFGLYLASSLPRGRSFPRFPCLLLLLSDQVPLGSNRHKLVYRSQRFTLQFLMRNGQNSGENTTQADSRSWSSPAASDPSCLNHTIADANCNLSPNKSSPTGTMQKRPPHDKSWTELQSAMRLRTRSADRHMQCVVGACLPTWGQIILTGFPSLP